MHQFLGVNRFRHEGVEAGLKGAAVVGLPDVGGDGDGGERAAGAVGVEGADAADEVIAILAGHADIAEQHIYFVILWPVEEFQGFGGGFHVADLGAGLFEEPAHDAAGIGFVLDEEEADAVE